jgi:hypothetical protein
MVASGPVHVVFTRVQGYLLTSIAKRKERGYTGLCPLANKSNPLPSEMRRDRRKMKREN